MAGSVRHRFIRSVVMLLRLHVPMVWMCRAFLGWMGENEYGELDDRDSFRCLLGRHAPKELFRSRYCARCGKVLQVVPVGESWSAA